MNLEPTEEQRQIVATVRRFVREEIVPLEAKLDPDASELPPDDFVRADDHLAACAACRLLADGDAIRSGVSAMRGVSGDAMELEHPGHDEIVFAQHFPRCLNRPAAFENGARRHLLSDLLRNLKFSGRRFEAAFFRSQAESRRRNRIRRNCFPAAF